MYVRCNTIKSNYQITEHLRKLHYYVTNEGVWLRNHPGLHVLLLDFWCLGNWFIRTTEVWIAGPMLWSEHYCSRCKIGTTARVKLHRRTQHRAMPWSQWQGVSEETTFELSANSRGEGRRKEGSVERTHTCDTQGNCGSSGWEGLEKFGPSMQVLAGRLGWEVMMKD